MEREGHRPDIDGLRGLAVSLVVLFHAWPPLLPGGFAGVDVFFVISGFVVGRMVQRQLERGTFSTKDFFVRRINRLAPALLVTVLGTLGLVALSSSPTLLEQTVVAAAAGLAMGANVLAGFQSSYFDPTAELKPLLHLWSLGVEEQFYLSIPAVVWLVRRLPRARWSLGLFVLVASFLGCLALSLHSPTWAYFLPVTRAWELLAGVLLAARVDRIAPRLRHFSHSFALAGLVLVVGGAWFLGRGQRFPSEWTLLPVVGTVWILMGGAETVVARVLSLRPIGWLGLVSYSLYLWHWPVLTLLRLATPKAQHVVAMPVGIGLSVALAWLTTRFLERPVRERQSPRIAFALASAAVVLTTVFVTAELKLQPEEWAFLDPQWGALNRFLKTTDFMKDARLGTCLLTEEKLVDDPSCTETAPPEVPLVFVWGDSFAGRLTAGLRTFQGTPARFRVAQRTRASCPPLLEPGSGWCKHGNAVVFDELKSLSPQVLVLHAMWTSPAFKPNELDATLGLLTAALPTTKIVVVGQPPLWRPTLPWVLTHRVGDEPIPERLVPATMESQRVEDEILQLLSQKHRVQWVSAIEALCSTDDTCLVRTATEPLMLTSWDEGHLTTPAAVLLARHLVVDF